MKRLFVFLAILMAASLACAGPYRSVVVTSTVLTINVGNGDILTIQNFTQEGGAERGVITVVTSTGATANVLNAAMIDNTAAASPSPTPAAPIATPEFMNKIVIAGPVTVTIPPVTGAQLFITFRKESQPD